MPLPGRKPKPAGQAVNRNKPTHEYVEIPNVPAPGRELPATMPNGKAWPYSTEGWWANISTMPHTVLWTESDWQFAYDTAYIAAMFHATGRHLLATELRNREKIMGTTLEFRLGLRIRYVDPVEEDIPAEVTRLDDFRDL